MFGLITDKKLRQIRAELCLDLDTLDSKLSRMIANLRSDHFNIKNWVEQAIKNIESRLQSNFDKKTNALEARIAKLEAQLAPLQPHVLQGSPVTAKFDEEEFQKSLDLRNKN